jgi:hypothetical protein
MQLGQSCASAQGRPAHAPPRKAVRPTPEGWTPGRGCAQDVRNRRAYSLIGIISCRRTR